MGKKQTTASDEFAKVNSRKRKNLKIKRKQKVEKQVTNHQTTANTTSITQKHVRERQKSNYPSGIGHGAKNVPC